MAHADSLIIGTPYVIDGDSLGFGDQEVRLHGIDAPELHQACTKDGAEWPCGVQSADHLKQLIGRSKLRCDVEMTDRYKRKVVTCFVRKGKKDLELNRAMVADGWAFAYRKYSMDYASEEDAARAAKIGIWSGEVMPPGDWRRQHPRPKEDD